MRRIAIVTAMNAMSEHTLATIWKSPVEVFVNRINTFNRQKEKVSWLLCSLLNDLITWFYTGSKCKDVEFQSKQDCATEIKGLLCSRSTNTLCYAWCKMQTNVIVQNAETCRWPLKCNWGDRSLIKETLLFSKCAEMWIASRCPLWEPKFQRGYTPRCAA